MPDLEISRLPGLAGNQLQATDPLAVADLSASETKRITVKDLIQGGVALIDAGSIPTDKLNFTLPPSSVGTAELKAGSVTADKLAANSTTVVQSALPAAGGYLGQMAYSSSDGKLWVWNGGAWTPPRAAGSINTLLPDTTGPVVIMAAQTGDSVQLGGALVNTVAAGQFLAGPTGGGGVVGYRVIAGTDLPVATSIDLGGVSINGDGLRVTAAGVVQIANDVTASAIGELVTYDAKGLVTGGHVIGSNDLPAATTAAKGAVFPGPSLAVTAAGELDHKNVVAPGTGIKVTYDSRGHVTTATALSEVDIPSLSAAKLTTGTLDPARIRDRSITQQMLANYAIAYIQDTQPANTNTHHNGMLWLNPLAQQIRMWDGNVWVPIGVGALSEQNLRFCGLFDAADGKITVLTQFGRDAGYKVGDVLPTATDQLTGCYFVVHTAGNGTAVTPGVAYDPGDWCICLGVAQGWSRVDTLSGGGGGGGASTLDGLVDVDAPSPGAGQVLQFDGAVWKPALVPDATTTAKGRIELATQAEVDAGTDTVRAVTPATLKQYVDTASPSPVDASTTVKGIIQLATAAEVLAGTDALKAVTPKEAKDHYLAKNIALLAALP